MTPYIVECEEAEEPIRMCLTEAGLTPNRHCKALTIILAKWIADNMINQDVRDLARAAPKDIVHKAIHTIAQATANDLAFVVTKMALSNLASTDRPMWQRLRKHKPHD